MENSLYVGSLSDYVTADELRKRFTECGVVADVQIAVDRGSGRPRGHAFVTMATAASAQAAVERLNGAMLDGRQLRVSIAGGERTRTATKRVETTRITSQFRERRNMSYELECDGRKLLIKSFHPDGPQDACRMEASTNQANSSQQLTHSATGATRAQALQDIAQAWQADPTTSTVILDWPAITGAMAAVHAI